MHGIPISRVAPRGTGSLCPFDNVGCVGSEFRVSCLEVAAAAGLIEAPEPIELPEALTFVVMVSDEPFLFNVATLAEEAELPLFLWCSLLISAIALGKGFRAGFLIGALAVVLVDIEGEGGKT